MGTLAALSLAAPIPAAAQNGVNYTWTGFYAGIQGGGGWSSSKWHDETGADVAKLNGGGVILGVNGGYNWQNGPVVIGIETDISWSHNWAKVTNNDFPLGAHADLTWLSTVRGRIGTVLNGNVPNILVYGTGGIAFGRIHGWYPEVDGIDSNRVTKTGWVVSAGIEGRLSGNWTMKAEFLYVNFGSFQVGIAPPIVLAPAPVESNTANYLRASIFQFGLNYHF